MPLSRLVAFWDDPKWTDFCLGKIIEVVEDLECGLLCTLLPDTHQLEEGAHMLTACSVLMLSMGGSDGSQCGTHSECVSVSMPPRLDLDGP